jgi:hypothetical protein
MQKDFPFLCVEGFCEALFQCKAFTPESGLSDFRDNLLEEEF